jgi:hypothetical protein
MYSWLWRHLPGPTAVRALLALLLLAAAVAALFLWVFPWAVERLPGTEVSVEPAEPAAVSLATPVSRDR